MCGRFTQLHTWSEAHAYLNMTAPPRNLRARYYIAPTTTIDVARNADTGRELVSMRWGLVPIWWKKPLKDVPATFNARAETVAEKPMFRGALRRRRAIIPASGFYEWTGEKDAKQPHLFTAADGSPVIAFAALWDRWHEPDQDEMLSATIIVTEKSAWMSEYHDRMPVLLNRDQIDGWLDGSLGMDVLRPAAEDALRERPISPRINRTGTGDDDPTIIEPLAL